jgi:hypothetical protein
VFDETSKRQTTEMTSKTARIAETVASVCGLRRRERGEGVAMEGFGLWFDSRGFFLRDLGFAMVLHVREEFERSEMQDYTLKLKNGAYVVRRKFFSFGWLQGTFSIGSFCTKEPFQSVVCLLDSS